MTGNCLCGDVTVSISHKPDFAHDCNCSLCRKTGAAWGYYKSADVSTQGDTISFVRRDKPDAGSEVHSCKRCGVTTHFQLTDSFKALHPSADQVGVNMKLFRLEELEGIEVRFPNGKDWPGQGEFGYRRSARWLGDDFAW